MGRSSRRLETAARSLAARGWFVFPLRPWDKRPLAGFTRWEQQATRDLEQIARWWAAAPYNIGLATGPSRLVVIDCDTTTDPPPAHVGDARCGIDVLRRLANEAGEPLPATFTVHTPRGGTHLYFQAPARLHLGNTAGKLGWHIDTRGAGGYVVAPSSVRPAGRYRITTDTRVAPLPKWVINKLTPRAPAPTTMPKPMTDQGTRRYVQAVLACESRRVTNAQPGSRNNTLNTAAFILGQFVGRGELSEVVAPSTLSQAAQRHIGIDSFTEHEVAGTITSGLRAGMRSPRNSIVGGPYPPARA